MPLSMHFTRELNAALTEKKIYSWNLFSKNTVSLEPKPSKLLQTVNQAGDLQQVHRGEQMEEQGGHVCSYCPGDGHL